MQSFRCCCSSQHIIQHIMLGIPWSLQLDGLPQGATHGESTVST